MNAFLTQQTCPLTGCVYQDCDEAEAIEDAKAIIKDALVKNSQRSLLADEEHRCNSLMCRRRSEKREFKALGSENEEGMLTKNGQTLERSMGIIEREIEALRKKEAMQVYEDRCESPMCWFKPGRTVQDVDKEQGSNHAREDNAIQDIMETEADYRERFQ